MKRYAIVRHTRGASVILESGPHTRLGAKLRIHGERQRIVPWEGNASDTLDAYVARSVMRANPGAHYPESWKRWREPVLYTDYIDSVTVH